MAEGAVLQPSVPVIVHSVVPFLLRSAICYFHIRVYVIVHAIAQVSTKSQVGSGRGSSPACCGHPPGSPRRAAGQ